MNQISVELKNCYGIKDLEHKFDSAGGNAFLIYAPNGSMKSSLARVFRDISEGGKPRDAIFLERETSCSVTVDSGGSLNPDDIFVVDPYREEGFSSTRVATLLADESLKQKYEFIHTSIEKAMMALLDSVGATAGITRNLAQGALADIFGTTDREIHGILEELEPEVIKEPDSDFSDIAYLSIFNSKAQEFLNLPEIGLLLDEYVKKYDELIDNSLYFRKGIFNHNNAFDVGKSLTNTGFFKANHSVSLIDINFEKKEVTTQKEFDDVIEGEKARILKDPKLVERFDGIDKAITKNRELRDFRIYLEENPKLLPELADLGSLKRKIWTSYLIANKSLYVEFLTAFRNGKKQIEGIVKVAKEQATIWHRVVEIFNDRFSVPFVLEIANQDDVILKSDSPSLVFKYKDGDDQQEVGRDDLLNVLSAGERRALLGGPHH